MLSLVSIYDNQASPIWLTLWKFYTGNEIQLYYPLSRHSWIIAMQCQCQVSVSFRSELFHILIKGSWLVWYSLYMMEIMSMFIVQYPTTTLIPKSGWWYLGNEKSYQRFSKRSEFWGHFRYLQKHRFFDFRITFQIFWTTFQFFLD